jgi:hypothetical protein
MTGYKLNCFREVLAIVCVVDSIKGSIDKLFTLPVDVIDDPTREPSNKKPTDSSKLKWLTNKFTDAKKDFDNMYGDHIAILKIFGEYEVKRKDKDKLREWSYKYFIDKHVLETAYQHYIKLKYRYRQILAEFDASKPDDDVLALDLKYKVMASFAFGYNQNIIKIDSQNKVTSFDGKINDIQLEKNNFINKVLKPSDKLFYYQLYRYDKNPIKAKIVSFVSKKSISIIEMLN